MMTSRQDTTFIGENYNLIEGMANYIAKLRETDEVAAEEFIENVSNTPTAYYKLLEVMIGGEDLPMTIQNRAKVRFVENDNYRLNIRKRMLHEKLDVTDIVRFTSLQDHEDYIRPLEPGVASLEFAIMEGDLIMDELESEFEANRIPEEHVNLVTQTDPEQQKREMLEKCAQAVAKYNTYMSDLKKSDSKEYKLMTALHSIYKKENESLRNVAEKISKIDQQIKAAGYLEKYDLGTLTDAEDKKWDELTDKQMKMFSKQRELRMQYDENNDKRVEKGVISQRHAKIRAMQLFNGDFTSLPMRKWDQTKEAGQYTDYYINEKTGEKVYLDEAAILRESEIDNVTKEDPTVVKEAEQIAAEKEKAMEEAMRKFQAYEDMMEQRREQIRQRFDFGERGIVIDKTTQQPIAKEDKKETEREEVEVKEKEEAKEEEELFNDGK